MKRRRAPSLAVVALTALVVGLGSDGAAVAHREDVATSDAKRFAIATGRTPADTKFRLFAQKARVDQDHRHLGSGAKLCLTLKHRVYSGSCGLRRRWRGILTDVSGGVSCGPDWSHAVGAVSREVADVRVRFDEGETVSSRIYRSPKGLGFSGQFFIAFGDKAAIIDTVEALDKDGNVLKKREGPEYPFAPLRPCDPLPPH